MRAHRTIEHAACGSRLTHKHAGGKLLDGLLNPSRHRIGHDTDQAEVIRHLRQRQVLRAL